MGDVEEYTAYLITLTHSPDRLLAEQATDLLLAKRARDVSSELRDDHGQWTVLGAAVDAAEHVLAPGKPGRGQPKDRLKLAGRIHLEPGEHLLGSGKVNGDNGAVHLAMVDHGGVKSLRLGIGGPTFGGRYDDAGPWKAGPDPTAAINAERKRLSDERDRIGEELDRLDAVPHADPARKAALQARHDELDDMQLGEVYASGFTAVLEPGAARQLHSTLSAALDAGAKLQTEIDADREPPRPQIGYWVLAEGSVPGRWADVHYEVYLDDPSVGVEVHLAASPHGSGMDVHDLTGNEQGAVLYPAEARKLLRLLAGMGTT